MATQSFTILPHIHPVIHTFTHRRRCQPCKAPAGSWGAVRVRCLAHGHLNTQARRSRGSNQQTYGYQQTRSTTWPTCPPAMKHNENTFHTWEPSRKLLPYCGASERVLPGAAGLRIRPGPAASCSHPPTLHWSFWWFHTSQSRLYLPYAFLTSIQRCLKGTVRSPRRQTRALLRTSSN